MNAYTTTKEYKREQGKHAENTTAMIIMIVLFFIVLAI